MKIICLDLEGVLIPEIWINLAQKTGIQSLSLTTRDIPDYKQLMRQRLSTLEKNNLTITDIHKVVEKMSPLDGATDFIERLREKYQLVILSDTFYEFVKPLMRQLNWPTLFCHHLEIQEKKITKYKLRTSDHKRKTIKAFKELHFNVFAAGDSFNDTSMLMDAELGVLFNAPIRVIKSFPNLPTCNSYDELLEIFEKKSLSSW